MLEEQLLGRIIEEVAVSDQRISLKVRDLGWLNGKVWGDCCSDSYIEKVVGAEKILNKRITDVKEFDLQPGELDSTYRQEELRIYGIRISVEPEYTYLGEKSSSMIIDFRNESNGYYGGYIEWQSDFDEAKTASISIKKNWINPHG